MNDKNISRVGNRGRPGRYTLDSAKNLGPAVSNMVELSDNQPWYTPNINSVFGPNRTTSKNIKTINYNEIMNYILSSQHCVVEA